MDGALHLNDPAFYEKMSQLLDEVIRDLKSRRIDYEAYLKRIADLAERLKKGYSDRLPECLDTPAKRALYNNLSEDEDLAIAVHEKILGSRPDGWRGVLARENMIKKALFEVLGDELEVERLYPIIHSQEEY